MEGYKFQCIPVSRTVSQTLLRVVAMSFHEIFFTPRFLPSFLQVLKDYPCVWDPSNAGYYNKEVRQNAFIAIRDFVRFEIPLCTEGYIRRQVKLLKITFKTEMHDFKKAQSMNQIYETKIWYFPLLWFMNGKNSEPIPYIRIIPQDGVQARPLPRREIHAMVDRELKSILSINIGEITKVETELQVHAQLTGTGEERKAVTAKDVESIVMESYASSSETLESDKPQKKFDPIVDKNLKTELSESNMEKTEVESSVQVDTQVTVTEEVSEVVTENYVSPSTLDMRNSEKLGNYLNEVIVIDSDSNSSETQQSDQLQNKFNESYETMDYETQTKEGSIVTSANTSALNSNQQFTALSGDEKEKTTEVAGKAGTTQDKHEVTEDKQNIGEDENKDKIEVKYGSIVNSANTSTLKSNKQFTALSGDEKEKSTEVAGKAGTTQDKHEVTEDKQNIGEDENKDKIEVKYGSIVNSANTSTLKSNKQFTALSGDEKEKATEVAGKAGTTQDKHEVTEDKQNIGEDENKDKIEVKYGSIVNSANTSTLKSNKQFVALSEDEEEKSTEIAGKAETTQDKYEVTEDKKHAGEDENEDKIEVSGAQIEAKEHKKVSNSDEKYQEAVFLNEPPQELNSARSYKSAYGSVGEISGRRPLRPSLRTGSRNRKADEDVESRSGSGGYKSAYDSVGEISGRRPLRPFLRTGSRNRKADEDVEPSSGSGGYKSAYDSVGEISGRRPLRGPSPSAVRNLEDWSSVNVDEDMINIHLNDPNLLSEDSDTPSASKKPKWGRSLM